MSDTMIVGLSVLAGQLICLYSAFTILYRQAQRNHDEIMGILKKGPEETNGEKGDAANPKVLETGTGE